MDVLDEIRGLGPDELSEWLQQHGRRLSKEQLISIRTYVLDQHANTVSSDSDAWSEVATALQGAEDRAIDEEESTERATQSVTQDILEARRAGTPVDLSSLVEMAPEHLSTSESATWATEVQRAGREEAESIIARESESAGADSDRAAAAAASEVADLVSQATGGTPRWITENFGVLSEEQKTRAVEYWNDLHGTRFETFEEMSVILEDPSEMKRSIIESATLDVEPLMSFKVVLPGRRPDVSLTADEVAILRDVYGFSNDAITRVIRLAGMLTHDPAEDTPWQAAAALLAGSQSPSGILAAAEQSFQDQAMERQRAERTERTVAASNDPAIERMAEAAGILSRTQDRRPVRAIARSDDPAISVALLLRDFKDGLKLYNQSATLAYLHAMDRGLASRIAGSGGDPRKLAGADNARAVRLLTRGGLLAADNSSPFGALGGIKGDDNVLGMMGDYWATYGPQEPENVPEEPVRQRPDPEAVRGQVTQLWQALFRQKPSEDVIQAFQNDLNRLIDTVPMEQTIDVTARIRSFAEGQPIYDELYGQKVSGLSEEEYQAQFLGASRDMLGNEAPDEGSIRQGMKSGSYQTTVGSIAGSSGAWQNSRFLERLALAANVVGRQT